MERRSTGWTLALLIGMMSCWMTGCGTVSREKKAVPTTGEEVRSDAPDTACHFRDLTAEPVQVGCEPGEPEEETK